MKTKIKGIFQKLNVRLFDYNLNCFKAYKS